MANTANPFRIPLGEREALTGLLKVKPAADMPRPGAQATTAKKKARKKRAK